jgi:Putative peptidoglycan binding domain
MKTLVMKISILMLLGCVSTVLAGSADDPDLLFHSRDALAPRDDLGWLHQSSTLNSTDFAKRYHWRPLYWLEGQDDVIRQPAYVGAVQRDLTRLGYYCGPIDGVYTDEVSDAIARLQKNYSMRVTGTLTLSVRRALHLP